MTILQADGTTEVTLHGPVHQNTPQNAALGGPAGAANRGKRRRKPSTGKRPENVNMARKRALRTKLTSITCQRVNGLQRESLEDPALHPALYHIDITHQLREKGNPLSPSGTRGPTLDPTHPVHPDPEGGHIHDPEAFLDQDGGLILDPDLDPILYPDPGRDQDPGTDLGLHPEKGVCLDPQEAGEPVNPNHRP